MYTRDLLLLEEQKNNIMNKIKLVLPTFTNLDLDRDCYIIFSDPFKLRNYIKYIIESVSEYAFRYKTGFKSFFHSIPLEVLEYDIYRWLHENGIDNAYQTIPYLYILDIKALRSQILRAVEYKIPSLNFIYLIKIRKIDTAGLIMRDLQELLRSNCIYLADMEEQFGLGEV